MLHQLNCPSALKLPLSCSMLEPGAGSQGDYQKFMSQYASDFQKYMQGQGKGGAGDYQKYMSDFQQYMKGQGGSQGGDASQHVFVEVPRSLLIIS